MADVALVHEEISKKKGIGFGPNTWIGDMGVSTYMDNCDQAMTNVRTISDPVQIGNGNVVCATKVGDKHVTVIQKHGPTVNVVLRDYKYVPNLH